MSEQDRAVLRLAARQHNAFSRPQAHELGFSNKQIRHRIASGIWTAAHRDVFLLAAGSRTIETRCKAATLALPGSAGSHATAGSLLKMIDLGGGLIHVSRRHGRHHRLPGVRLHQSRYLPEHHVTSVEGIPVTTRERTIFDLASRLDERRLGRLVDDAVRSSHTTLDDIGEVFRELASPARPGTRRMAVVLDHRSAAPLDASELELRFHDLCVQRGLPIGSTEVPAPWRGTDVSNRERVDVAYAVERLIVELDSRAYHTLLEDFESDRLRDQMAIAAGWRTIRFTWRQVVRQPKHVERILRSALLMEGQSAS